MEYEVLVGDITDLVRSYRSHRKVSIEAAMKCGRLLIQAQRKVQHGDWAGLLEQTSLRPRTAQRWIRLARAGVTPYAVWKLGGLRSVDEWLGRLLAADRKALYVHECDDSECVGYEPGDPGEMHRYFGAIMNLQADGADVNDESVERGYDNICELAA